MTGVEAVFPLMRVDEEADRTDFGRGTWTIGLARNAGDSAEIQVATDLLTVSKGGDLSLWSLWDENAEKRDEPVKTMGLAAGTWTYYSLNDPFGMPQVIEKTLGSATQPKPAVR